MKRFTNYLATTLLAISCVASVCAEIKDIDCQQKLNTILNDKKRPYTVVKFWKEECQPCDDLAPHFEAVADDLGDQVNFVAIEGPSVISRHYKIKGFPTTLYFKNGKRMPKEGTRNVNRLEDDIRAAFGL